MRSMFGAGKDRVELGLDWASNEARIQGKFCKRGFTSVVLTTEQVVKDFINIHR